MVRSKKILGMEKTDGFVGLLSFLSHTSMVTYIDVELNHDYMGLFCHGNSLPLSIWLQLSVFLLIVYAIHGKAAYFRYMFRDLA